MDTRKLPPQDAVIEAIVAHIAAHPMATDTAAGVMRWWLGMAWAGIGIDEVEGALATLVDRAVLRRLTLSDGSVLYAAALPTRQ